jgi:hypothetical protein
MLSNLEHLQLYGLFMLQAIPSEIGMLTSLTMLELYGTDAAPSVPTQIGLLTRLTSLSVSDETAPIVIPTEVALLTNLHALEVDGACAAGGATLTLEIKSGGKGGGTRHHIEPCPICSEASVPVGETAPANSELLPASCARARNARAVPARAHAAGAKRPSARSDPLARRAPPQFAARARADWRTTRSVDPPPRRPPSALCSRPTRFVLAVDRLARRQPSWRRGPRFGLPVRMRCRPRAARARGRGEWRSRQQVADRL